MLTFDGFQPKDFAGLTGTTWRSRLGGVLSRALTHQPGQRYRSWGVSRKPELHIALEGHYDFRNSWPCAKLFVYAFEKELAFGLHLESTDANGQTLRSAKSGSAKFNPAEFVHWRKFATRLRSNSEMRQALLLAMQNHSLTMTDYSPQDKNRGGALGCKFAFPKGGLQMFRFGQPTWEDIGTEHLVDRIAELPKSEWVNLHVFDVIQQDKAIGMGSQVINPILSVLRALVPVYETTIQ